MIGIFGWDDRGNKIRDDKENSYATTKTASPTNPLVEQREDAKKVFSKT